MSWTAPFAPLVAGGAGLDRPPISSDALRRRMAEVYGVDEACVLPVRGRLHGIELVFRLSGSGDSVSGAEAEDIAQLARIYGLKLSNGAADVRVLGLDDSDECGAAKYVVIDESGIEFGDEASCALAADNVIAVRDLALAYGLAGAPCGALIAKPALIEKLRACLESDALATPVIKLAEAALDPVRAGMNQARVLEVKAERARVCAALTAAAGVVSARESAGPFVMASVRDANGAKIALRRAGVAFEQSGGDEFRLGIGQRAANDRLLAAFGAAAQASAARVGEVVRETLETKIAVRVDLDGGPKAAVDSGVGYFDHMLAQVAMHGGFSIALACKGDLEVDTHHTIEDCALALGEALKQALGDKRGIARYGFLLPMDEAEAKVSVDLGGRPYSVFEGSFAAPLIGAYPTEMTEHIFRSLGQSMAAAIHVSVTGENDHHKTEACFKAFGRALRQAVAIEGANLPSTKGVL